MPEKASQAGIGRLSDIPADEGDLLIALLRRRRR